MSQGTSFRKPITFLRFAAGQYVNGRWVKTSQPPRKILVRASLQPANSRDMQSLPEGRRNSEAFVLFTDVALRTAEPGGQTNPDITTINGENYEVTQVAPWQNGVASHFRYLIVKAAEPVG